LEGVFALHSEGFDCEGLTKCLAIALLHKQQ
jgi:hypothetical protein